MKRSAIPEPSRRRRSRIAQIVTSERLVRGTLSLRNQTCGNPRCRCASGQGHPSLYLVQTQKGKQRQLYIPKLLEARVRKAVSDYKELQSLVEELSEQEWKLLKQREE